MQKVQYGKQGKIQNENKQPKRFLIASQDRNDIQQGEQAGHTNAKCSV